MVESSSQAVEVLSTVHLYKKPEPTIVAKSAYKPFCAIPVLLPTK